ncbi:MAG: DUF927 domain-containing protein [Gemmataceae bacterium]|nr:DUF927 domain-containing protein [Gemmataceae bacterium]
MSRRKRPKLYDIVTGGTPTANGHPAGGKPANGKPATVPVPRLHVAAPPPAELVEREPHPVLESPTELTRLAHLSRHDPGKYAAELDHLKKVHPGLSLPKLEKAVRAVASSLPPPALTRPQQPPYYESGNVIYKSGPTPQPLCNFTARIVADVTTDDGAETRRRLRLAGRLATGADLPEAEVPAERFAAMDWPMTAWGTRAIVHAGGGNKDHLRAAIQTLSGDVRSETVYAHTGWREVGGGWVYLHAGGAIGAAGPTAEVRVAVPPQLAGFALPDPPAGERLRAAVRASLGITRDQLAPAEVAVPLLLAPYRAALGGADYSFALVGRTGAGKSELAALAQQHFGKGLDARHLPANWSNTANATEALAFAAKDALLVIDDYCPANPAEAQKLQAAADRLFRNSGNNAGRSRLNAGAELRPGKPPRGLMFSTGEDQPGGASLRARLWTMEVTAKGVSFARLTGCQRDAAAGLYAESLAGFVRWLAAGLSDRRERHRAERDRYRAGLTGTGGHARVPTNAADLMATLDLFLTFAREVGAIDPAEAERVRTDGHAALCQTGEAQAAQQEDADPARRFVALLASVLSSGRAHLMHRTAEHPDPGTEAAVGWRRDGRSWRPQGECVGWFNDQQVYLNPASAFAAVKRLADDQGQPLTLTQRAMWRHLHEAGDLAEVDQQGKTTRSTVRRAVRGTALYVVVLPADRILASGTAAGGGYGAGSELSAPADDIPL